jgi:hypothetical protein
MAVSGGSLNPIVGTRHRRGRRARVLRDCRSRTLGPGQRKQDAPDPASDAVAMRLRGRNVRVGRSLLAILLDARRAQARKAMAVDRILPGQKLLNGEGVTAAGFFERQQAATHGGHHFSLAADHPTLRPRPITYFALGRWGSVMGTLTRRQTTNQVEITWRNLKFG